MQIVEIPFKRVMVKINGINEEVFETEAFWFVRDDNLRWDAPQVITNPFILMKDLVRDSAGAVDPVGERQVCIRLVPSVPSNPGQDDNSSSLTTDLYVP